MPLAPIRGRTTQNTESSAVKPSADLFRSTLATTWLRSSLSAMAVTWPITTFLYRTWVLLASMPMAVWKLISIFGPALRTSLITLEAPTRLAMIGTTHNREPLKRRVLTPGAADGDEGVGRGITKHFHSHIP